MNDGASQPEIRFLPQDFLRQRNMLRVFITERKYILSDIPKREQEKVECICCLFLTSLTPHAKEGSLLVFVHRDPCNVQLYRGCQRSMQ